MRFINHSKTIILFTLIIFAITSCKKDDENPGFDPNGKGSLIIHFDNVAGNQELILNTKTYTTSYGDYVNISKIQYYISNIKLKNTNGTEYVIPVDSSYFLVQEADAESQEVKLKNIPFGDYNGVTFTVGVDSLRNTVDVSKSTGALDIGVSDKGGDMYWNGNMGYIFLKLEGTSPNAPLDKTSNTKRFLYHIGGYGGMTDKTINNLKIISLSTGTGKAMVRSDIEPEIHLAIDVLKAFGDGINAATKIDLANNPVVMWGDYSKNIANNYVHMFEYDHVHNDVIK